MATGPPAERRTITSTEFKAKCLRVRDRLAPRERSAVNVAKRGEVVAVLTPPRPSPEEARSLFGRRKGSVTCDPDFDWTGPVCDEPLDFERGVLHR